MYSGKRVLEIGCGDGTGAEFLKERGAEQVLGVDLDGPDLQQALQREAQSGVSYGSFDGMQLDSPSASFDIVVGFDVSTWMESGLLDEIQRVLHLGVDGIGSNRPDFLVAMCRSKEG